jgi:hypothetical protein
MHGAQLHGHLRLVPVAGRRLLVSHADETTPYGQMFLVSAAQPLFWLLVLRPHPKVMIDGDEEGP